MEVEHSDRGIHPLASWSNNKHSLIWNQWLDPGHHLNFKTMAGDNENAMPDRSDLRVKLIKTTND